MFRNLDIDFRVFSITDIEIDSKNKLSAGSYGETFVGTIKDKFENSIPCVVKNYIAYKPNEVMDEDIIKEIIFLRLLNQFNVEGVVKLYGVLMHQNHLFLVLEKLDTTLHDFRVKDRTHVDPAQVKRIFHDLLVAIDSMHALGILHNDLKLANIMLKGEDIKLIDFGLSKFIGLSPPYKQVVGSYLTTQVIMAPDNERISYATDVFSIGRTMFHFYLKQYQVINQVGPRLCVYNGCFQPKEVDAYFGYKGYELLTNMLEKKVEKRYCASQALDHSYFKSSKGGSFEMKSLRFFPASINTIKNKNLEYCYSEKIYANYKNDPLTLKSVENDRYNEMINELLKLYPNHFLNFDSFDALVNGIILTNQHFETYISDKYKKWGDFLIFNVIIYQIITSNYSNIGNKNFKDYLIPNFNVNLIEIIKFDINFYPISSQLYFIYSNLIINDSTTEEEKKMLMTSNEFLETCLFNILFWFIQSNILSNIKINDIIIFCVIKVLIHMKIDWTKYSFLTMTDIIYQRMYNYMIDTISQMDIEKYEQYANILAYDNCKFPIEELKSKVSLKKLLLLKYSIQMLIDSGFTLTDLLSNGFDIKQIPKNLLITNNYDFFKKYNYKKNDFKYYNISPLELNKMGASLNDLVAAGYTIFDLVPLIDKTMDDSDPEKPFKLNALKDFFSDLKDMSLIFDLKKLFQFNNNLSDWSDISIDTDKIIKSKLFPIKELKKYYHVMTLKKYYNPKELYDGGLSLIDISSQFSPNILLQYFSLQDLKNEGGMNLSNFRDEPISKLMEVFSLEEFVREKKPLHLLMKNYKISELKKYFNLEDFLNNGVSIIDLKNEFSLKDFVTKKIQPNALLSAGFTPAELKEYFKPIQLLNGGIALSILKDLYPLIDLKRYGISATSLRLTGVEYDELKNLFRLDELIKENIPLKELLYDYKFSISELKLSGFKLNQFQSLNVSLRDLKGIFDLQQLLEAKFPLSDFKGVYTIMELKNAGVKPDELISSTFEIDTIYQFYTLSELIDAKIPLGDLKLLGATAYELKNVGKGITLNNLVDTGYTLDELTAANFSARELFLANIKLSNIFKTGAFKYSDIKESYHEKPDAELELLLKKCTKNILRKTNPECRYDPVTNNVINPPVSRKGGRHRNTRKSKRAKK